MPECLPRWPLAVVLAEQELLREETPLLGSPGLPSEEPESSRLPRAMGVNTGQLHPSTAYSKVGRGKGKQSHPRVPPALGIPLHILIFSFPGKEAERGQGPSQKGK